MVETARGAGARRVSDKTIVLTGAMIPYAFGSSDGLFNLGQRAVVRAGAAAGVYIAMNGQCFPWDGSGRSSSGSIFGSLLTKPDGNAFSKPGGSPGTAVPSPDASALGILNALVIWRARTAWPRAARVRDWRLCDPCARTTPREDPRPNSCVIAAVGGRSAEAGWRC